MTTPEPRPNVTALPGLADEDTAQLTGNEEFLSTEDGLTLSQAMSFRVTAKSGRAEPAPAAD